MLRAEEQQGGEIGSQRSHISSKTPNIPTLASVLNSRARQRPGARTAPDFDARGTVATRRPLLSRRRPSVSVCAPKISQSHLIATMAPDQGSTSRGVSEAPLADFFGCLRRSVPGITPAAIRLSWDRQACVAPPSILRLRSSRCPHRQHRRDANLCPRQGVNRHIQSRDARTERV